MTAIQYVEGDATSPLGDGTRIVIHIVNNVGAWGKGFVLAVSRRWPEVERRYRRIPRHELRLGEVQFVPVDQGTVVVANMVAQHGLRGQSDIPPIRYDALATCLKEVAVFARKVEASIHLPRIGCGLAGGKWENVERLVEDAFLGFRVVVYDPPGVILR